MQFDIQLFLCALGLAFIIEGIPYFVWAEKMPRVLLMLAQSESGGLRKMGVAAIVIGLIIIFFARRL
ncbi:MAG: DUF2065 domain-containing protein [Desulfonatronovibrionaceae bacterium]